MSSVRVSVAMPVACTVWWVIGVVYVGVVYVSVVVDVVTVDVGGAELGGAEGVGDMFGVVV